MAKDQVELLTHQKAQQIHPRDTQHVLANLPVRGKVQPKFLETLSQDEVEFKNVEPNAEIEAILTGLRWFGYSIAIAATIVLALWIGMSLFRP